jgi:hypothetical protein
MPFVDPVRKREYNRLWIRAKRARDLTWKHFRRNQHLRSKFGMTREDWERMLAAQGYCCASCGRATPGRTKFGKDGCWHTDHDPTKRKGEPGYVRGILCHWCNIALHQHQTPQTLRALADYLERRQ